MTTRGEAKQGPFVCPYCDAGATGDGLPYCEACGITIFYCPLCRRPVGRESTVCPDCGAHIGDSDDPEEE